jgi:hypothetical protein
MSVFNEMVSLQYFSKAVRTFLFEDIKVNLRTKLHKEDFFFFLDSNDSMGSSQPN